MKQQNKKADLILETQIILKDKFSQIVNISHEPIVTIEIKNPDVKNDL